MGSNSLSRVALLFDEFFDLKNFLGLAMASEPEKQIKNDEKIDKILKKCHILWPNGRKKDQVQNGSKLGPNWVQVDPNGSRMSPNRSKWVQMGLNGFKWVQMRPNRSKCVEMGIDMSELVQMGLKWV